MRRYNPSIVSDEMVCYLIRAVQSTTSSGGALERGFRRVINAVPVGSLLIQSDAQSGEPLLLHVELPICVRFRHTAEDTYVFLMDAQVCSPLPSRYCQQCHRVNRLEREQQPSCRYAFFSTTASSKTTSSLSPFLLLEEEVSQCFVTLSLM